MRLRDISLNNLKRRKSRMFFCVAGLVMGVATVVSLITITNAMHGDIQDKVDQFGANIVITPKSDEMALSYGGVTISSASFDTKELRNEDAAAIWDIELNKNISVVAPKLVGGVDAGGKRVLLVGVDFPSELKMKKWWNITGREPNASGEAVIGSRAATYLGLMPGSEVKLGSRPLKVTGVLQETGGQEDSLLFADLATAQAILGKPGSLSLIEVSALCKGCPIEEIIAQISGKLPDANVNAVAQAVKSRQQTVDQLTSFSVAISAVVVIIGALIVLTTMMNSVNERKREIGIFRAIGFRKGHVVNVIMLEALLISLLGGILGWIVGSGASMALGPSVAQLASAPPPDLLLGGIAIVLAMVVGLGSSVYPAIRAANVDPVIALRYI
ncbi:MAG: ABC transporter permease [Chloroflexi bacterium]|nr:ABC transporter permease [Chloroflexota bacterium]